MHDTDKAEPTEVEEVFEVVTTAKLMTEVVITAVPITTAAQVPKAIQDKGKGILIEEPKPLKGEAPIDMDEAFTRQLEAELNANINWNDIIEQVKRSEKQDNTMMRYQALKRKPVTEAQARKNMMIYLKNMVGFKMNFFKAHARKNMMTYLKNMAGFKMNFFKGITYNEIRPLFEKHYHSNQAFLERVDEEVTVQEKEIEEEGNKRIGKNLKLKIAKKQRMDEEADELKRHQQIVANDDDDLYIEAIPLASKVPIVDYQIRHENNKPYYTIIRADETYKLFLSFITLLKNFDREDLETL
nr:hypothetical protein [Tanacetum cinerariifolium]